MQLENLSPTGDRAAPVSGQGHMSLDPSAPSPGPPARRMGGCLPVNDRRALHDALRCVPELVRSADGHQGPEPPAGPHGAGPRDARPRCSCVCVLTRRPGRHKTEGFGPGDCCQDLPCLSAISTFPARVDPWEFLAPEAGRRCLGQAKCSKTPGAGLVPRSGAEDGLAQGKGPPVFVVSCPQDLVSEVYKRDSILCT